MALSDRVNMFYNAKPSIFEKAKALRQNMTPAEQVLWNELKGYKLLGFHFRPQHPIDIFIADFYCHKLKLVIEIDGEYHLNPDRKGHDANRTAELERLGIKVIRFTNDDVLNNLYGVLGIIKNFIANPISHHPIHLGGVTPH